MTSSARRSVAVVAAFGIAALVVAVVALRAAASERANVERDARARLRATASEVAGTVAATVARLQSRALTDPEAAVVRDGRFLVPPQQEPLLRLADSDGSDLVGERLLDEAERLEVDPARVDAARARYEEIASDRDDARHAAVQRRALFRLAALERRAGRDEAAAAARAVFLDALDPPSRCSIEALFVRIESEPRDAELQRDLLLRLGGSDEAIVLGMLRDAKLDDPAAIAARRAVLERIARLDRLLFPIVGLSRTLEETGAIRSGHTALLAYARAENGEHRILEGPIPPLPDGVELVYRAAPIPDELANLPRSRDSITESVEVGPVLRNVDVEASTSLASLDAEAASRVRLLLGGVALLLLFGGGLLVLTLRAVRRESEAAAARTAFVTRVSHDLRTPLSVIRMYTETIAQGRATRPEEIREFASVAAREAERLTALVARVLDFSRTALQERAAPRAPVDLRELLQQTADDHAQALAAAGMQLELVVSGERLLVRGDREGLRAALVNLLDNALRHASGGGRIDVVASARGGEIEVRVGDRGPGLPSGLETRIFEPFVRGPQARPGGNGLGLALVKEVALAHGGRIAAGPREGGGALFTLVLPRAIEAREPERFP